MSLLFQNSELLDKLFKIAQQADSTLPRLQNLALKLVDNLKKDYSGIQLKGSPPTPKDLANPQSFLNWLRGNVDSNEQDQDEDVLVRKYLTEFQKSAKEPYERELLANLINQFNSKTQLGMKPYHEDKEKQQSQRSEQQTEQSAEATPAQSATLQQQTSPQHSKSVSRADIELLNGTQIDLDKIWGSLLSIRSYVNELTRTDPRISSMDYAISSRLTYLNQTIQNYLQSAGYGAVDSTAVKNFQLSPTATMSELQQKLDLMFNPPGTTPSFTYAKLKTSANHLAGIMSSIVDIIGMLLGNPATASNLGTDLLQNQLQLAKQYADLFRHYISLPTPNPTK